MFSVSDASKVKMTVQRGLEQIRTLKNQGMHPKLVVHLATDFGEKVKVIYVFWNCCKVNFVQVSSQCSTEKAL